MCTGSATRWWSKWEVVNQVCDYFGYVEPFRRGIQDLAPALHAHVLEIFDNSEDEKIEEAQPGLYVMNEYKRSLTK